jgi:RNA polymerase I-specific transcription initiation factor RRN3
MEDDLMQSQFKSRSYSARDDINTPPQLIDDSSTTSSEIETLTTLRETITTLDALMTTLFDFLDTIFKPSPPSSEAIDLFDSLMSTFLSRILPTYHSRHAQFLIFTTSQSADSFLDTFLGILIERSLDSSLPTIDRQASSAYLASFVARAKCLSRESVQSVVEMLCAFLQRVNDEMPITSTGKFIPGGTTGNRGLEGVYAVYQAVLYIYCFRWRELRDVDEETGEQIWHSDLPIIERMAWSPLNPLAVCLPRVMLTIAYFSRCRTGICFEILRFTAFLYPFYFRVKLTYWAQVSQAGDTYTNG